MKRVTLTALFFWSFAAIAQKNEVCFTIDDLPVAAAFRSNESQTIITAKLLHALKKHNIPAFGFVNENKLYKAGEPIRSRLACSISGSIREWNWAIIHFHIKTFIK